MNEPTLDQAGRFFIGHCLHYAQSLSLRDARLYLKGLLGQVGESAELAPLREMYEHLLCAEKLMEAQQLPLFETSQKALSS